MRNDSDMTDNTYSASAIASTEKEEISIAHVRNKDARTVSDVPRRCQIFFRLESSINEKMFL